MKRLVNTQGNDVMLILWNIMLMFNFYSNKFILECNVEFGGEVYR